MRILNTSREVIQKLEIIYYKKACLETTINFLRENTIRNETIMIRSAQRLFGSNNTDVYMPSTEYFLDLCYQKENEYRHLRMDKPAYIREALPFIEDLESHEICLMIYSSQDLLHLRPLCQTSLDGIMNHGLSDALGYMYTQFMKANLKFNDKTVRRDERFLKEMIADKRIIEIIDLKAKVLDPAFN
jgi:hypothetical protein